MNKENTIKLWEKYPIIFSGRYLSLQESLIPFGFECGSPETFMGVIESVLSHFMFKRKWGVYYWKIVDFRKKFYRTAVEKISDVIQNAEHKSYDTCELCGEPGKTRGRGWITTQCDKCWKLSKLNR
jgi:hypothetical protein